ncbi:MAG: glycosyltransferase [Chitinophagaceae bacterium]|nr:MAG: glycosyltransferase [Chitinophagaceae bacterium]
MEKPLVSVVLCTFNGASHLQEQVDSILRQTYRPLELIIADDASTDDTKKILQQYESNPVIKVVYREKNTGLARNFAITAEQTKGELIAFSDQDDIWMENKIETLVGAIGNSPLVYSDSLLVDEKGNSMNKKLSDLKRMYTGADSRGYMFYNCVWGHSMLIKRELLLQSYPMPVEIHHDVWLAFQAFLNGGILYHDEVLTHYRRHSATSSEALPQKLAQRKRQQRYQDYHQKLHWIQLMDENERDEYKPFYRQMIQLYSMKEKKSYVWPLVFFMLKHRKAIFRLTHKYFLSQLIEILKQARGERP